MTRRVPKGIRLHEVFSFEETRAVMNDWTIIYKDRLLQILKDNRLQPIPKERVKVSTLLDGQIELIHKGKKLKYEPITASIRPMVESAKHRGAESVSSPLKSGTGGRRKIIPSKTHPWRRNYKLMWGRQKG